MRRRGGPVQQWIDSIPVSAKPEQDVTVVNECREYVVGEKPPTPTEPKDIPFPTDTKPPSMTISAPINVSDSPAMSTPILPRYRRDTSETKVLPTRGPYWIIRVARLFAAPCRIPDWRETRASNRTAVTAAAWRACWNCERRTRRRSCSISASAVARPARRRTVRSAESPRDSCNRRRWEASPLTISSGSSRRPANPSTRYP